jgi:hypothetical protein
VNKADYILIPAGFNAFVREADIHADVPNSSAISETRVQLVNNRTIDIYFRCNRSGNIKLALDMLNRNTGYQVRATASVRNSADDGWDVKDANDLTIDANSVRQFLPIAEFYNETSGYVRVSLQPISTASALPEVYDLGVFSAGLRESDLNFGKRLASTPPGIGQMRQGTNIHLGFTFDSSWGNIEYLYNELTVEEGFDPSSTYFMANGSQGGYLGMQVNSRTTRRILFSIWSTWNTQNPNEIPANYSVEVLRNGDGVTQDIFGNEGSGRNCYINAMWKTGLTYKFLKRVQRRDANNTIYTAWWFDPETNKWNLMASYRQPHNQPSRSGWYTGPYSFVECFWDHYGQYTDGCYYGNQWARNTDGQWREVTRASYTTDSTQPYRKDYLHIVRGNRFYMSNGGFFNATTSGTSGTRPATGTPPNIDLSQADNYIIN